jgi:hypothetical protein
MLSVNLVEPVPDRAMVVEVETAREGDLGPGGSSTSVSLRRLAANPSRPCSYSPADGGSPESEEVPGGL